MELGPHPHRFIVFWTVSIGAVELTESPFLELEAEFEQGSGFNLYDRDEDSFHSSPTHSPSHEPDEDDLPPLTLALSDESRNSSDEPITPLLPQSDSHTPNLGTNTFTAQQVHFSPQSPPTKPVTKEQSKSPDAGPGETTPPLYCICKDPIWDSSMIECQSCHNYFHGNCIGISRLKATLLKRFYCPVCVDKDPSLVTEFGTKEEREMAEVERKVGAIQRKQKIKKHSRRCVC